LSKLGAYVITYNEERQIERCLASLLALTPAVLVVDSGSSDATVELARAIGVEVETHPFTSFSEQRNHALTRVNELFGPEYVLALDADELIESTHGDRLRRFVERRQADVGVLPVRVVFFGRQLRHGNRAKLALPRLFRSDLRYEGRLVNEHLEIPPGRSVANLDVPIIHDDDTTWSELVEKASMYARREAEVKAGRARVPFERPPSARHLRHRWIREQIYERLPGRVPLSFIYQYVIRRGFLDGRQGFDRAVLDAFIEYLIIRNTKELERVD
jgi:glycosyltransferase involved in cell wall biosynthesis